MADTFSFEEASAPAKAKPATFFFEDAAKPTPAKPKEPEKSLLGKFADIHPGIGGVEAALNLGAGTVLAPVSGLAGLGTAAAKAVGLTNRDPADVVRNIQGLAYQPRTQAGKGITEGGT